MQRNQQVDDDDEKATIVADLGGKRPRMNPGHAAIGVALGCYLLLHLYAGLIAASEGAYWAADMLTITLAGATAGIQWWRGRAWFRRYHAAYKDIVMARLRRDREAAE